MAALKRDDCRPALVRLDIDEERRGAKRSEPVERVEEPRASRVCRRESEDGKSWADDPRRPMQHLGRREGFGVDGGRFLELERGLGGDGERGAPPDHEQG